MVDTRSAVPLWRRLAPRHLLLLVPWVGLGIAASAPIRDNSFLWHVRAGTLQLDIGRVLTADPFSFTMQGAPWRTQSWLAELGYGLLERWTGGLSWVPVMQLVVGAVTMTAVGVMVYRRSRSLLATGLGMAAFTWLAIAFQVQRPALLSFMLLAVLVLMLDLRVLWPVPVVVWVWAGVHGSWIIGVGLVVLWWWAGRLNARRAVETAAASLVLASLTAHGLGVGQILLDFLGSRDALALMSEWAKPDLLSIPVVPFTAIGALVLVALASGRLRTRELWVVGPFLLFGLLASRNLLLAAIVLLPEAAKQTDRSVRDVRHIENSVPVAVLNVALAAVLAVGPLSIATMSGVRLDEQRFPIAVAPFLGDGPLWHDDLAGGYLIYSDWPNRRVYIDDRAELYGAERISQLIRSRRGEPAAREVFNRFEFTQALVRADAGLNQVLPGLGFSPVAELDGWRVWKREPG